MNRPTTPDNKPKTGLTNTPLKTPQKFYTLANDGTARGEVKALFQEAQQGMANATAKMQQIQPMGEKESQNLTDEQKAEAAQVVDEAFSDEGSDEGRNKGGGFLEMFGLAGGRRRRRTRRKKRRKSRRRKKSRRKKRRKSKRKKSRRRRKKSRRRRRRRRR